jgi:uncharacterized delta-60 repeat protein
MKRILSKTAALVLMTLQTSAASLSDALDAPDLVWTTGGAADWVAQSVVTHDGVDAARSGTIGDSQVSWLETTVAGPGLLSFWWKVSSETNYDYLEFYTNGVRVARISGEVDWQIQTAQLAPGPQTLLWFYAKDGSVTRGQDAGWLDQVVFVPPSGPPVIVQQPASQTNTVGSITRFSVVVAGSLPLSYQWFKDGVQLVESSRISGVGTPMLTLTDTVRADTGGYSVVVSNSLGVATSAVAVLVVLSLSDALDAPELVWTTGGDAGWVVQFATTHDGVDAARSGPIADGQDSWLETVVFGPGPLSFWWKVSSETNYDYLEFYTNGVRVARISGEVDWQLQQYNLGPGRITLRWRYMKDSVVSSGQDAGWVDQVLFRPPTGPPVIMQQPASQVVDVGGSVTFSVLAGGAWPLAFQWIKDGLPVAEGGRVWGANTATLELGDVTATEAGHYQVVLSNVFGMATSAVAVLAVNLATADRSFAPSANGTVYALAQQPDGKIVVGGYFTNLVGQARYYLGRLNVDGTLDPYFEPRANGSVECLCLQADGKVLVGGWFTSLAGQPRNRIARLNPDGTLDQDFNPGASSSVECIAVQPDGKILLGGNFTTLAGQPRSYLARLNPDGTLDESFNPGANAAVYAVALQTDGRIVVGGKFTALAGQACNRLGRLNSDGTLDTTFNPGANADVYSAAVQPDGKVVVGGNFTTLGGAARSYVARLNPDGTLDNSFTNGANRLVYTLGLQADGKILVGGRFTTLAGQPRNYLARLNPDGTLDPWLSPSANAEVYSLVVQPDGKVLVGGSFATLGGQARSRIGRLNNVEPASQSLSYDGSSISWLRGGSSPELGWCTFEYSPDNLVSWLLVGIGTRSSGGWQLADAPGLDAGTIRASGYVSVGGVSGGFVHSYCGKTGILIQPTSRTNDAGTLATFSVVAVGTGPISYQWFKDDARLSDGGIVSGANTASLTLNYVLGGDAGTYFVVVSNAWGAQTSQVAALTVQDPVITAQPANRVVKASASVRFSVAVVGTEPLSYQWFKDGVALADGPNVQGAQTPTLTLPRVLGQDTGLYHAVVSNRWGSATSAVAALTVQDPAILTQPLSQVAQLGEAVRLNVEAAGTPLLSYQWFHDGLAVVGAEGPQLTLSNLLGSDAGLYWVVVSNRYGSITSAVAELTVNLATLDGDFQIEVNGPIHCLAVQTDGKILVGGYFSMLNGQPRTNLARLNSDGTLDATFRADADDQVVCLAVQADGRIVVGGWLSRLGGQSRSYLGRLNPDGSVDLQFNPGPSGLVTCIAVQPDGKILVGGSFSSLGGQTRYSIGRLNPDGSLDLGFNPRVQWQVNCIAVQPDGKILLGGWFSTVAGQPRANIARLNPDGTLDASFNPGADQGVYNLAVQADNKILLGGIFTVLAGQPCGYLGRLNPDGSLDPSFKPEPDGMVSHVVLQADGKILLGGWFTIVAGRLRHDLARLNADGTVDSNFHPQPAGGVLSLGLQADGKILLGGYFTSLAGRPQRYLGRLHNLEATQSLNYEGNGVTWLRGGTSPEVAWTLFDYQEEGGHWVTQGAGTRVPGGWQFMRPFRLPEGWYRVRAYVPSGGISGWFVETQDYGGRPLIIAQPVSRLADAGTSVNFTTSALGSTPMLYQWFKDGVPLVDGPNVQGAQTPTLTLPRVLGQDTGLYHAVVSNRWGSATSAVAALTVQDPAILTQPLSQVAQLGEAVRLNVEAAGTPLLSYQWFHDGLAVVGAEGPQLTLSNLLGSDAGLYWVVVSNRYGSITSAVAELTVNLATLDGDFQIEVDGPIYCLAVQPDGKILVGGDFSELNGQARTSLGRLNPDGTVDPGFAPELGGVRYPAVHCLVQQPDGKIVVGGEFWTLAGQPRRYIGRLNPDGRADPQFDPGANATVQALALQSDGRILVGGLFTMLGGQARHYLGRLNADGSLDPGFNPGADGWVACFGLQSDGKIVIGGGFSAVAEQPRHGLARLHPEGTLDTGFDPRASGEVWCLAVQPDDRLVVGGGFTTLAGQHRAGLGRLNPDGTVDLSFDADADDWVSAIALQADGKIIVAGWFGTLAGQLRSCVARLNPDGTLDANFNPEADSLVSAVAIQPDGRVLLGGEFSRLAGQPTRRLGRLQATAPVLQHLVIDGSRIRWQRSGSGPELAWVKFEYSVDGVKWLLAGLGTRVVGGWQWSGAALPPGTAVRACGYVAGAGDTGWVLEDRLEPLAPIRLSAMRAGTNLVLHWTGGRGPYQVQQCTDLGQPSWWTDLGEPIFTNSIALPIGTGNLFLRVKGQSSAVRLP